MRREVGQLFTAGQEGCKAEHVGSVVHACKHPCHFGKCGQPAKGTADYLAHAEGDELWLNIIDPDEPLFSVELFRLFLDWAVPRADRPMLIHCNAGDSRSRSLALLVLAATGRITTSSYEDASRAFEALTASQYRPGRGIGGFLDANWREILAGYSLDAPKTVDDAPTIAVVKVMPSTWAKAIDSLPPERTPPQPVQVAGEAKGYTLQEFQDIADDPELWARMHGKIPDRVTGEPIDFMPSILQRRMFAYYRYCQSREVPCRMIIVKIRRGGGSTGLQAILYVHVHNYKARVGAVGTNETVSMNMFKMIRFFDQFDSFGWARHVRVLETGLMEWGNGSLWEKYTAENPEAARSAGLQGYGATEVGRWPDGGAKDAGETLKSMLGAVPRRGFTVAGEESTAQGGSGAFADRFARGRWPTAQEIGCAVGEEWWRKWADETPQNIAATQAERDLQFVRIAAGWFEDIENVADVDDVDEAKIRASLDAKELELIRRYQTDGPLGPRLGVYVHARTIEQLALRRAVIDSEFEGDVEAFEQENPSSPKEAFASSGRHTFNRAGCAWMRETAKVRPPDIGILARQPDGGVVFVRTDAGQAWFSRWEEPREGMRYIEGVDTCGGRSNQRTDTPDYNSALIMRTKFRDETGRQFARKIVGALHPKNLFDPDMLARHTQLMSDYYGTCLVVFEVNNTGASYRDQAKQLGMNLYREEVTDKHLSETTEYIGWTTTHESREQLIGTLKKAIRNNGRAETRGDGVEVWSMVTADECHDMIRGEDGKDQAPGGKHDDHVMALGFCIQCEAGATYYAGRVRRRRQPADRGPDGWKKFGK